MKKNKMVGRKLCLLSMVGFLISALSVLLLPFSGDSSREEMSSVSITIGVLFWFGILLGILFYFMAWNHVRGDKDYHKLKKETEPAIISFCSSKYAAINDIVLVISVITVAISAFFPVLPDMLVLIAMFLDVYTLCSHFLLNGRVYRFLFENKK